MVDSAPSYFLVKIASAYIGIPDGREYHTISAQYEQDFPVNALKVDY
jgi:hypothetical protein